MTRNGGVSRCGGLGKAVERKGRGISEEGRKIKRLDENIKDKEEIRSKSTKLERVRSENDKLLKSIFRT